MQFSIVPYESLITDSESFRIDAEFFKPQYLEVKKRIDSSWEALNTISVIADGDHSKFPENQSQDVRYLRAKDLKGNFILDDDPIYVSNEYSLKQKRSWIKEDYILLSIMGSVGEISLTPHDYKLCIANRAISIIKQLKRSPAATFVFLTTKYGVNQIDRFKAGGVQERINLFDLGEIKIPKLAEELTMLIEKAINLRFNVWAEANKSYLDAESMLISELGLNGWSPRHQLTFTKNFLEMDAAQRMDAEYFQPMYDEIINHIKSKGSFRIGDKKTKNRRGVQPIYFDDGNVKVLTSKHIQKTIIDYDNLDHTSIEEWDKNRFAQLKQYDILTYTTGANVGRTQAYLIEDDAVGSNHVNILRIKDVDPIYAAFFLNSILGQLQVNRKISGTAQAELYPTDIDEFVIWSASDNTQKKVRDSVISSYNKFRVSSNLLKASRQAIELSLETTTGRAIEYLQTEIDRATAQITSHESLN